MKPVLKDMVPMLICDDVQASIRFYTEILGFTVTDRMDDLEITVSGTNGTAAGFGQ